MPKRVLHPFTIHIHTHSRMRNRFGWLIRQDKQTVREGWMTYATFEDARIAGKDVLDRAIADWVHQSGLNNAT